MKSILAIALLVSLTLFRETSGRVALENFYPYGTTNGDSALLNSDDDSTSIMIDFDFPYFGRTYRQIHISTNGIINFGSGSRSYTPSRFPLRDFRCIAAYWSDSNPASGGNIFYRESTNTAILNRINDEIRLHFIEHRSFASRWALITTYDNVAQYGCGSTSTCSKPCSNPLMYQAILTSDGVNSFTMFLYNNLSYTAGTADCSAHAQIGFNAGDNRRFYLVPTSNTDSINSTAISTSNVGVPGLWMFSVEGSDITTGCNNNGRLEVSPRKTLYFGQESITITGPCFNESAGQVTVTFGEVQVVCQITNKIQLKCTAPYFTKIGSTQITLTYRSILYTTFIMIADIDDQLVAHADMQHIGVENLDAKFQITWNSSIFGSSDTELVIQGFQIDASFGDDSNLIRGSVLPLNFNQVLNTGSFDVDPTPNLSVGSRFVRIIYLILHQLNNRNLQIVRIIDLATTLVCDQHCRSWYKSQPSATGMNHIIEQVSRRSPCAPAVPLSFPRQTGNFELDSSCNPGNPALCKLFHPGASGCYRSTNNFGAQIVQCCYDVSGRLMLGPPGGGTLDFDDSRNSLTQHFWQDVLPYFTCCRCTDLCSFYYEKRPSIDSRWFVTPGWGNGGGDPHFKTLDGTEYTFNPVGEFVYLATDTDIIQVRISQYVNENDIPKEASFFSAFVVKGQSSDKIQIELNEIDMFRFRVNGEVAALDLGTWNFNGISVNYFNRSIAEVHTSSGLLAEFHINGGVLNVILSIPKVAKSKVSGLIGNWDGNPNNDFQLSNGTTIPISSSQQDIHKIFGMSWSTTSLTSLFTYPTGLTWIDYQDPGFIPNYSVPPENPQCNGNAQCNYDAHVTGNVCVGLANVLRNDLEAKQASTYEQLSKYCPLTVTVNNGEVEVNEINENHVEYRITCHRGVKMRGSSTVVCRDGQYDPLPTCKSSALTPALLIVMLMSAIAL